MAKQKASPRYKPKGIGDKKGISPYEQGFNMFRSGNFAQAIKIWQELPPDHPERNHALAEAHFRRYLTNNDLADLEMARRLTPQDGRLAYHLGLTHHRAGRLSEALSAYEEAARLGFSPRRLQPVRVMAEIEHTRQLPAGFDELSEMDRGRLLPALYLLQNRPQDLLTPSDPALSASLQKLQQEAALLGLWQGLAAIAQGQTDQALESLAPRSQNKPLPAEADAVRAYYHGLALMERGQVQAAVQDMQVAAQRAPFPALLKTLATLTARQAQEQIQAGEYSEAQKTLEKAHNLAPDDNELLALLLTVLDQQAHAAAARGDWRQALSGWDQMNHRLLAAPDLEPTGVVVHNLAVACERLEQWENAAGYWNELIGLLPRRPTQTVGKHFAPTSRLAQMPLNDAKDWLRKRVILCYQKAGQPERSVEVYRKAAKQDPADLPLRMGLVNALVANEQWVAARNELERIIAQDGSYVPARVTLAHIYREEGYTLAAEEQLRKALEIDPNAEAARQEMSSLLVEMAENEAYWNPSSALNHYQQALQYRPDDSTVMASVGQLLARMNKPEEAQQWFERVLAKGGLDDYGLVFTAYLNQNDLAGARQIVERFAALPAGNKFQFYLLAGTTCLTLRFAGVGKLDPQREQLGREMMDRAIETENGQSQVERVKSVVAALMEANHMVALDYAEGAANAYPEDASTLAVLALLQAMNDREKDAKASLQKAEKLAQKQHNHELLARIRDLREQITNPLLKMMGSFFQMRGMLDDMGMDEEYLDEWLEDFLGEEE